LAAIPLSAKTLKVYYLLAALHIFTTLQLDSSLISLCSPSSLLPFLTLFPYSL
jgi:hypothetical protein